jgi:hypothetical protein
MTDLYRPAPVTQRDGSELASSNCRLASAAVGLEYESWNDGDRPPQTSTGSQMRARQDDQSGGTDSGDAAQAWSSYGQALRIRDGMSWADAVADLEAGRLVHLDVWAAAAAGPCLSGTGGYGHTIAVSPERSGTRWLVCDPWCSPPKWTWWEEVLLETGAETWGGMTYSAATAGTRWTGDERALRALMRLAAKRLMTAYRPDLPAVVAPPADTAGSSGRIMFTTTRAPGAPGQEVLDMPIAAAAGLVTTIRARVPAGTEWFKDPNLAARGGGFSSEADVVFVGSPVGESVAGGSYAILFNTGALYGGDVRPTIAYVATGDVDTYSVPAPVDDLATAIEERDLQWREWILEGNPGDV